MVPSVFFGGSNHEKLKPNPHLPMTSRASLKVSFCTTGTSISSFPSHFSATAISRYVCSVSAQTISYLCLVSMLKGDPRHHLHLTSESRTHNSAVGSPCFFIGCDYIHSPVSERLELRFITSSVTTYNRGACRASGLTKLVLCPPPITCRATSILAVKNPCAPNIHETTPKVSFPNRV